MLPLFTQARISGVRGTQILKVLTEKEAAQSNFPLNRCLLWQALGSAPSPVEGTWAGIIGPDEISLVAKEHLICVDQFNVRDVVRPGDVIRLTEDQSRVSVLYRRGANSNTFLATEQCNSFCLMCSQPPKQRNDYWLVEDILNTLPLIDRDVPEVGISGGEPTLLGDRLIEIIVGAKKQLPNTRLHILTNGRNFKDARQPQLIAATKHPDILWGIPLYSATPEVHDYIVQSPGAWHETTKGLYNLARHNQKIELRVVVQKANADQLCELAYFLFRNFSFVAHVAFMGLEPIGFSRSNYEQVWIDPVDYADHLKDAVFFLANRGMSVSIYNAQLCTMPRSLWPYCDKSISDWKNVYHSKCESCDLQRDCGGLFQSFTDKWISRQFGPMRTNARNMTLI